jgi:drug/metabolite transporter superfamily protein YnfA
VAVYQNSNDLRQDDAHVRDAVRFGLGFAAAGVIFLVVAAVWVSTCDGATADIVACGAPQRTLLAIGAPVILLIGGLRAFFRAYQAWRNEETWWAWQGAGWFLLTLMLLVLTMSMPALAGPAMFGG